MYEPLVVLVVVDGVGNVLVVLPGDLVVPGVLLLLTVDVELSFDRRKYKPMPPPMSIRASTPMMIGILLFPPAAAPY